MCDLCEIREGSYIVDYTFNFIEQKILLCERCVKHLELDRYDNYRKITSFEKVKEVEREDLGKQK